MNRGRAEVTAPIAAVVLAAGRSRRFGTANKLFANVAGVPLLWHALAAACASPARPVIVVTGHQQGQIKRSLRSFVSRQRRPLRLKTVFNLQYRAGMSSSLLAGLTAVPEACSGAVICLGDMPQVSRRIIRRLVENYQTGANAVVPVFAGRRGNPVLLGRPVFAALQQLRGDEGARRVLARADRVIEIEAGHSALRDIDTQRDWRALRRRLPR